MRVQSMRAAAFFSAFVISAVGHAVAAATPLNKEERNAFIEKLVPQCLKEARQTFPSHFEDVDIKRMCVCTVHTLTQRLSREDLLPRNLHRVAEIAQQSNADCVVKDMMPDSLKRQSDGRD